MDRQSAELAGKHVPEKAAVSYTIIIRSIDRSFDYIHPVQSTSP